MVKTYYQLNGSEYGYSYAIIDVETKFTYACGRIEGLSIEEVRRLILKMCNLIESGNIERNYYVAK